MKARSIFFLAFNFCLIWGIYGQEVATGRSGNLKQSIAKDSLKILDLQSVTIYSPRVFPNQRAQNKYNRLVAHVKKVYPYAKQAGDLLKAEEANMVGMSEKERKAHMKQVEKNIEKKFSKELKALTFTQGRVLLKLIDRETGHTSYDLVDDLRGSFRAWFYNGIAGLFGYNLKANYEPSKILEDRYIEEIVRQIENGTLSLR